MQHIEKGRMRKRKRRKKEEENKQPKTDSKRVLHHLRKFNLLTQFIIHKKKASILFNLK
jgi:hypothetical protein